MDIEDKFLKTELAFARTVLVLAGQYQFSVTSWGRTAAHNARVGGVINSRHLEWLAVDMVCDSVDEYLRLTQGAELLGLQVIAEKDHIHVQVKR